MQKRIDLYRAAQLARANVRPNPALIYMRESFRLGGVGLIVFMCGRYIGCW